jgi:hypothetical protein
MNAMVCSQISLLLGFECHPLNEDGSVAMIDTSLAFEDGDAMPVYVEKLGNQVRFFDDGETFLHFYGRGVKLDTLNKTKFIKLIARSNGVSLNDAGELEIWSSEVEAPAAFAKYLCTMTGLRVWEKDQIGLSTDTSLLVEEVAQCLKAWKPTQDITPDPEYRGISGQVYKLDFSFDGEAVIALSPHHSSVSTAIKKLLDIRSQPENSGLRILAVIDDRYDSRAAKKEGSIMEALATVWPMTRLEQAARLSTKRLN